MRPRIKDTGTIAILPYMRTSKPIRIRGFDFRSTDDLEGVAADTKEDVEALREMFYIGDGSQVADMLWTHLPPPEGGEGRQPGLKRLRETRLLIGYMYSAHDHTESIRVPCETSTMFEFHRHEVSGYLVYPGAMSKGRVRGAEIPVFDVEDGFMNGYECLRDGHVPFWVVAGSKIYPEIPNIFLHPEQDLGLGVERRYEEHPAWELAPLIFDHGDGEITDSVRDRVFTGMAWYLRSCRYYAQKEEVLVHSAIALESLLRVQPGERLTERFKDAIVTLLGPVPRLDSWLEQFYTARSKAVHEGVPHELNFHAVDKEQLKNTKQSKSAGAQLKLRSLSEYARRIFRLSLAAIVTANVSVNGSGIQRLLVHNAERMKLILARLGGKEGDAGAKLRTVGRLVDELSEYNPHMFDLDIDLKSMFATSRLVLNTYLDFDGSCDGKAEIGRFLDCKSSSNRELFDLLASAAEPIKAQYRSSSGRHSKPELGVVFSYLEFVTSSFFSLRCRYWENVDNPSEPK